MKKKKKKYKENIQWSSMESTQNKAEIFIVYECGFSPVKVSEFLPVIQGKDVFRIPFPAYVSVPYKSRYADIMVDHKFKTRTIVMENIGKMAEDALSQRRLADITRATSRVFLRKQLAAQAAGKDNNGILAVTNFLNNIIEVADTRSWTSLPDNIQVARLWVTPNITHKIQIIPEGQTEPIALDINLTAGQKKFFRFRTFH